MKPVDRVPRWKLSESGQLWWQRKKHCRWVFLGTHPYVHWMYDYMDRKLFYLGKSVNMHLFRCRTVHDVSEPDWQLLRCMIF